MHTRNWEVTYSMTSNPDIHKPKGRKGGSLKEIKTVLALNRMKVEKPKIEKIASKFTKKNRDNDID